jgi:hypothetical protein
MAARVQRGQIGAVPVGRGAMSYNGSSEDHANRSYRHRPCEAISKVRGVFDRERAVLGVHERLQGSRIDELVPDHEKTIVVSMGQF